MRRSRRKTPKSPVLNELEQREKNHAHARGIKGEAIDVAKLPPIRVMTERRRGQSLQMMRLAVREQTHFALFRARFRRANDDAERRCLEQ